MEALQSMGNFTKGISGKIECSPEPFEIASESKIGTFVQVKHPYGHPLAAGIGIVAGLRPMTAPAIIAWAAKRRWINLGSSPFATIISGRASQRVTELAISELIADKLPFTSSRLNAGPLASRIASGAICGAAVCGAMKRPLAGGALLGGLGAIAGALAGHHVRKSLHHNMPDFTIGLLEDAVAVGGGAAITAVIATSK